MSDLTIQSHRGPYAVRFGPVFSGLEAGLRPHEHLIIDTRVAGLYSGVLARALSGPSVLRIEAAEANKSLEQFPAYVTHLIDRGIRRDDVLIAVGGGIIQDIAAFLAATLLRGIRWRFFPTTLLAQADSCIGSKSSVNIGPYKNQLGTFNPPEDILISTDVLATLTETDLRSGIGEMLKVHLIAGWEDTRAIAADYPRILRDHTVMERYIRRSLEIKQDKIEVDEFDRRERLVMNYGHSFGHAIESATEYAIPHGIAVTMGMDMANYVSVTSSLVERAVYDELHGLLALNYAGFEHVAIPQDRLLAALARDKKNVGDDIALILTRGPGQVFQSRCPNDERLWAMCREALAMLQTSREVTPCRSQ